MLVVVLITTVLIAVVSSMIDTSTCFTTLFSKKPWLGSRIWHIARVAKCNFLPVMCMYIYHAHTCMYIHVYHAHTCMYIHVYHAHTLFVHAGEFVAKLNFHQHLNRSY